MRYLTHLHLARIFTLMILSIIIPAQAGVVISGTRVVYPAQQHEVTVKLTNEDKAFPRLVQAWVDDGDEKIKVDKINVPFNLTPPVFRMEAGKSQAMRLIYIKEPLDKNKESLFWLNVLEVPPTLGNEQDNQLRFAFRIRIKLFFRPENLSMKPEDAREKLVWSLVKEGANQALEVSNPSPYYVSFQSVALKVGEKLIQSPDFTMVAPGGKQRYALKDVPTGVGAKVVFSIIDDYGAFVPVTASLTSATTSQAVLAKS